MNNKLFVGNISWSTSEDGLKTFFSQVGSVVEVKVITDRNTGRSKGFGFVTMYSEEEAKKAMEELNGKELDGRALKVDVAVEKKDDRRERR